MILYHHRAIGTPPPHLRGVPDLASREVQGGFVFGIGQPWMLGPPPAHAMELDGGWLAWVNDDGPDPARLFRHRPWLRTSIAADNEGREWAVPILTVDGKRAFKVAYGHDWRPRLTEEQELLLGHAGEASLFLDRMQEVGAIEDPAPGCAWAASILSACNAITPAIIGALGLMDDLLMVGTLLAATSRMQDADHG